MTFQTSLGSAERNRTMSRLFLNTLRSDTGETMVLKFSGKQAAMKQRLTFLIIAFTICVLISSCASFGPTSPNVSIIDPEYDSLPDANFAEAQSILMEIAARNDLLAQELGKLPEVQDGIEQTDIEALRVILNAYLIHFIKGCIE